MCCRQWDTGRLKVKSPYKHTCCTPLIGVTCAAHTSGIFFCFTFNCHSLHETTTRGKKRGNCQMLCNFLAGRITSLEGLCWGRVWNRGERRKRMDCKKGGKGRTRGTGTQPWSLQVKLRPQQIVSLQWILLTAACTLPLSNETDAIETDEQNSVKGNLKRVDLVEACRQSLAVSWCTGWHTPSLPITSHKHNGTLWLISNSHNLNSWHFSNIIITAVTM